MKLIDSLTANIIQHQLELSVARWKKLKAACDDPQRKKRIGNEITELETVLKNLKSKEVHSFNMAYA